MKTTDSFKPEKPAYYDRPYWVVEEGADWLGVSTKWLYRRIKKIPGTFKVNGQGRWFIHRDTFLDWLDGLANRPTGPGGVDIDGDNGHGLT